ALKHLAAEGTDRAIIDQLARVPAARLVLVRAARERRSRGAVPVLLELSQSTDEAVRLASLAALGVLGDSSTVEPLVARLLAAGTSQERAAAERAVWLCAQKGDEPDRRADAVLAAIEKSSGRDLAALLPVLGRIGAPRALAVIRDAVKNPDPAVHRAAVTALANWPDATVAAELLDLAKNEEHEASRVRALRGYIRVVTLRDVRPDDQTLAMLRPAVALASRLEEKRLIVSRLAAVVTPDSLELAASHLDEPELRKEAISTCVSLAEALLPSHPEPAKAAMRRVLAVTTDQAVRARLERHLKKTQ
ncbi:MAG: HEAT repeat domain-containing protein, partial [Pirellulales bacterium]|nr:HEAT repeat domain-containing protein [Pirellulales bacterium]